MNYFKKLKQLNLFCQYILNEIPKNEKSVIQLADCENFIVIKGKTTSERDLDFKTLKNGFKEKFGDETQKNFASHTIDLIEYKSSFELPQTYHFKYFSSENCFYQQNTIKKLKEESKENFFYDDLIFKTDFPIGLSNNMGKIIYYYGKLLVNSIPSSYTFEHVELVIPSRFDENEFMVLTENGQDLKLKSFFLDYYDFNFSKFEKNFENYDFYSEIKDPTFEPNFLREFPEDLFLI